MLIMLCTSSYSGENNLKSAEECPGEAELPKEKSSDEPQPSTTPGTNDGGDPDTFPQPSQSGSQRDPDILEINDLPGYRHKYHPGGVEWQLRACETVRLKFRGPNGVVPGGPDVPLNDPLTFRQIVGDGNCLFRALCFIITGSEEQHMQLRAAIVSHTRHLGELLWANAIAPELRHMRTIGATRWPSLTVSHNAEWEHGIEQYLAATRMERNGAWGTEVQIMTLAHLLDTPILTYNVQTSMGGWRKHNPGNVYGILDLSQCDPNQQCMYIRLRHDHYDVVMSVQ